MIGVMTDPSMEMTAKDIPAIDDIAATLPAGTRVNVTHLGTEDPASRIAACTAILAQGFVPVAHISARRLHSPEELDAFLAELSQAGASRNVFAVAGDPNPPFGPYEEALQVIRSGLLQEHGVEHVSIAGYPEGHPDISDEKLWAALTGKVAALADAGLDATILTQFLFDVDAAVRWIEQVRERGIDAFIRIGVPGPAGIKRLLAFATRFGIGANAMIVRKYGFSLTNLMGTAGPEKFIAELDEKLTPEHGGVGLHFYTFGGLPATAQWIAQFQNTAAHTNHQAAS
jgi:methylenetetrahydrofolate reductase (NADPH)